MDKDIPLTHISPLFMENCFHPLSNTYGEEDTRMIIATLPSLVVRLVPPLARRPPISHFCIVLRRSGRDIGQSEAIVLYDLIVTVLRRV